MVTNAAMTNRLSHLEDKGLLARETDTSNRRNVLVTLTPRGLNLVDELVALHVENQRKILAPLSAAEQEHLATLLATFLDGAGDRAHNG
jgi:DNA-binding MarR family transcriptional regulator